MLKIAPSLLAADPLRIGEEVDSVLRSGADWLHYDVMDGNFVPNLSFGAGILQSCAKTGVFCDAHLMVTEPDRYVDMFADAGARCITVHAEACTHLQKTLAHIRARGCMAGVSLNPATSPECLRYIVPDIDLVLVMTVNPGFGGQKLIPACMGKIADVRRMLTQGGSRALIEVDGGVNTENAAECVRNGADVLVTGSAFFKSGDRAGFVREMRRAAMQSL